MGTESSLKQDHELVADAVAGTGPGSNPNEVVGPALLGLGVQAECREGLNSSRTQMRVLYIQSFSAYERGLHCKTSPPVNDWASALVGGRLTGRAGTDLHL